MKLLTICIPCYNAIEYMHKALGSCLLLKDELEVIIIDKNSTDETYEVAMEYQNEYPDTFKVIKNTENIDDIKCAYQYTTGLYFKLLNSYDWFDQASLVRVIETLKDIIRVQANLDVLVTDYFCCYGKRPRKVSYRSLLPSDKIFGWHEIKHFKKQQYLLTPALIIKTKIIKEVIDNFPLNATFYMEMFAYAPLPYIRSFCYIDMPLYCFGRNPFENVINNDIFIPALLDTAREYIDYYDIYTLRSRKQRHYMIKYLSMITLITCALLSHDGSPESIQDKDDVWSYLKYTKPKLYKELRKTTYGRLFSIEGRLSKNIIDKAYNVILKLYGI